MALSRTNKLIVGLVVGLVLAGAIGIVLWLVLRNDDTNNTTPPTPNPPTPNPPTPNPPTPNPPTPNPPTPNPPTPDPPTPDPPTPDPPTPTVSMAAVASGDVAYLRDPAGRYVARDSASAPALGQNNNSSSSSSRAIDSLGMQASIVGAIQFQVSDILLVDDTNNFVSFVLTEFGTDNVVTIEAVTGIVTLQPRQSGGGKFLAIATSLPLRFEDTSNWFQNSFGLSIDNVTGKVRGASTSTPWIMSFIMNSPVPPTPTGPPPTPAAPTPAAPTPPPTPPKVDCLSVISTISLGEPKTRSVTRAQQYTFTPSVSLQGLCDIPLEYHWLINPPADLVLPTENHQPLTIVPYILNVETQYTVAVYVGTPGSFLYKFDALTLNVVKTPLQAVVGGAQGITINVGTALSLSAENSADPDVDPATLGGVEDVTFQSLGYHYTWTVTGGQLPQLTLTGPNIDLQGNTFPPGTYSISMLFETPDRQFSAQAPPITLIVVSDVIPAVTFTHPAGQMSPLSLTQLVTLTAVVDPPPVDPEADTWMYQWSVEPRPVWVEDMDMRLTAARLQLGPANFEVGDPRYESWTPNTDYTFTCVVSGPNPEGHVPVITGPGSASITYNTHTPALVVGGALPRHQVGDTAIPPNFTARADTGTEPPAFSTVTPVKLLAGEWESGTSPLEYLFFRLTSLGDELQLSSRQTSPELVTMSLPSGTHTWGVRVYDTSDRHGSATASIIIEPMP